MRRLAVVVVFLALAGCGGVSLISLSKFPSKAVAAVPAPPVGVKDCPADIIAALDDKPAVPADAWIPKPTDPASKAGWASFLKYLGNDYASWANEGWGRSKVAKDWCSR